MSSGTRDRDHRPSPETLLAVAQREEPSGRLKVFLGAAPGVGKTYAMLQAAQQRKRDGVDVVIGIVETHGRAETMALIEGLEVIPRRRVEYRGRNLDEMDIDAVLARKPQLVLVDELAHTNAPGSRHPQRYLDVEELIAAGINVYTTVNIQHLESLNDAVAQITHIRVHETLPDRVIEKADEIQLIDLPPEDLIKRLREGKVYMPEQAERAIENYFRPGNLSALRELALRRTAERVDDQMQDYMQAKAISGPWPTTERIMVCVSPSPMSARLVRATKRRADRRNAEWLAVYVELPSHQQYSETDQARLERTLRLVEHLGGEAVTIPGNKTTEDLVQFAQSRNVTEIIIGKSQRSWWQKLRYGSFIDDLIKKSGPIDIHVISSDEKQIEPEHRQTDSFQEIRFAGYAYTTLAVVSAGILAKVLQQFLSLPNLSIIFLLGVLFSAIRYGQWPSIYASILSALIYNFFFIEPLYTFTIASPQEMLAFIAYFIVAMVAGNFTARVRAQAEAAKRREDRTAALFAFSRAVANSSGMDAVAQVIGNQISSILKATAVVLLPQGNQVVSQASTSSERALGESELAAATWAWQHGQPTGRGSNTLSGVPWLFLPLRSAHEIVGVLGVLFEDHLKTLPVRRQRLLEGLADLAAVAIERTRLVQEMEQAKVLTETEKLRAALLSSISHDLRTPLSSIIGSVSSLLMYEEDYNEAARRELLLTIQEEAERLNRFVSNLLDITRLESGKLSLNSSWMEIEDVLGSALARVHGLVKNHALTTEIEPNLPLLRMDFVLMQQVLVNLLDNAAKYSPPGSDITVIARQSAGKILLEVTDAGVGIPEEEREKVFDKFYRVRGGDRRVAGTGLGLSICRGIVEAHGGRIWADGGPGGVGTMISVELPIEEQPAPHPQEQAVPN